MVDGEKKFISDIYLRGIRSRKCLLGNHYDCIKFICLKMIRLGVFKILNQNEVERFLSTRDNDIFHNLLFCQEMLIDFYC